jgi:hypothetical protein
MTEGPNQPGEYYTPAAQPLLRAVQLTDDADWEAIAAWCAGEILTHELIDPTKPAEGGIWVTEIAIPGTGEAWVGDWIIRGTTGSFFIRKPHEFAEAYVRATT